MISPVFSVIRRLSSSINDIPHGSFKLEETLESLYSYCDIMVSETPIYGKENIRTNIIESFLFISKV
jgi:hypothetical protein